MIDWFTKKNTDSCCTKLFTDGHWMPSLTGDMVQWMKLGSYKKFNMNPISIETMIKKVDLLEGSIDRMMNKDAV